MVLAGLVEAEPHQEALERVPACWRGAGLSRAGSAKWPKPVSPDWKWHQRSRRTGNAPASDCRGGRP